MEICVLLKFKGVCLVLVNLLFVSFRMRYEIEEIEMLEYENFLVIMISID